MAEEGAPQQGNDANNGCSGCGDGCGDGCNAGTQKLLLIIVGLVAVAFVLVAITNPGGFEDYSYAAAKANSATATPTVVKQVSFEEKLESELKKANQMIGVDIESVTYNEYNKGLVIWLLQESAWNEEHLRKCFAYATFDIMGVIVKYPDKIDTITIAGKASMIDSKGHTSIDKVYQVKTTMDDAKTVNWPNLINYSNLMTAINNNFDSVWWHMAIRP